MATLSETFTNIANAIRYKLGGSDKYTPAEMPDAIKSITSTPTLQSKTVSASTSSQTVKPDSGYDGLSQVTVNAAALQTKTVTPSTSSQSVTPDSSYYGLSKVTVDAVSTQSKSSSGLTAGSSVTLTPDSGYAGLSSAKVTAASLASQTSATATADKIASGYTAWVNGTKLTGTASPSLTVDYLGLKERTDASKTVTGYDRYIAFGLARTSNGATYQVTIAATNASVTTNFNNKVAYGSPCSSIITPNSRSSNVAISASANPTVSAGVTVLIYGIKAD